MRISLARISPMRIFLPRCSLARISPMRTSPAFGSRRVPQFRWDGRAPLALASLHALTQAGATTLQVLGEPATAYRHCPGAGHNRR